MGENQFSYNIDRMFYDLDRHPPSCPICHHAAVLEQQMRAFAGTARPGTLLLEIVFQCPNQSCGHLFIGRYKPKIDYSREEQPRVLTLIAVVPQEPEPPDFPEEVSNISPNFVEIYTQASAAEAWGLDQVAGVGYRKALEFLIKDYCIQLRPDRAEHIKKDKLASVIKSFIVDAKTKECAQRAAWLGNDETHYSRRWLDKDIEDLKILIRVTVNWIHNEELTKRYIEEMRPGRGA